MKKIDIASSIFFVVILYAQSADANRWLQNSAEYKRNCLNWCGQNEQCHHCSTNKACGIGYERMTSWTGYSRNWHGGKQ